MRFVLDENVDARLARVLRDAGHVCWTVPESGLAGEADPNLSVYAIRKNAVLVTHDKEFSLRVRRSVTGQHVYLTCKPMYSREALGPRLDDVVSLLERHPDLFLSVSLERIEVTYPSQAV